MKKKVLLAAVVVIMACGAAFVGRCLSSSSSNEQSERSVNPKVLISNAACSGGKHMVFRNEESEGDKDSADKKEADEAEEEPQTEEEKREAEAEKMVDAFDNLTDKWMEPSAKGVMMADVDNFAKVFRQVPKDRQDECIHRALNLIPDENVMLLAGVLMDKTMDKEIVETVYNDILNRDEDVKKPILQEIFKDESHPCWADTAWILDVTGDLPKKSEKVCQRFVTQAYTLVD